MHSDAPYGPIAYCDMRKKSSALGTALISSRPIQRITGQEKKECLNTETTETGDSIGCIQQSLLLVDTATAAVRNRNVRERAATGGAACAPPAASMRCRLSLRYCHLAGQPSGRACERQQALPCHGPSVCAVCAVAQICARHRRLTSFRDFHDTKCRSVFTSPTCADLTARFASDYKARDRHGRYRPKRLSSVVDKYSPRAHVSDGCCGRSEPCLHRCVLSCNGRRVTVYH